VAKKKPQLQAFIDALPDTTEEEIEALQQPVWIRKALKSLKNRGGMGQREFINSNIVMGEVPDPINDVRVWTAAKQFTGSGKIVDYKIEVDTGDVFQLEPDVGCIILGSVHIRLSDTQWAAMMQNSDLVLSCSQTEYRKIYQARLNSKHP
jgi:hypothetical protein